MAGVEVWQSQLTVPQVGAFKVSVSRSWLGFVVRRSFVLRCRVIFKAAQNKHAKISLLLPAAALISRLAADPSPPPIGAMLPACRPMPQCIG